MTLTLVIVLMGALTYGLRLLGFALPTGQLAPFWRRLLDAVPVSVFASLIASSLPGHSASDTLVRAACVAVGGALLWRRLPLWVTLAVALALYAAAKTWLL